MVRGLLVVECSAARAVLKVDGDSVEVPVNGNPNVMLEPADGGAVRVQGDNPVLLKPGMTECVEPAPDTDFVNMTWYPVRTVYSEDSGMGGGGMMGMPMSMPGMRGGPRGGPRPGGPRGGMMEGANRSMPDVRRGGPRMMMRGGPPVPQPAPEEYDEPEPEPVAPMRGRMMPRMAPQPQYDNYEEEQPPPARRSAPMMKMAAAPPQEYEQYDEEPAEQPAPRMMGRPPQRSMPRMGGPRMAPAPQPEYEEEEPQMAMPMRGGPMRGGPRGPPRQMMDDGYGDMQQMAPRQPQMSRGGMSLRPLGPRRG
jgi:hypothetical protein